MRNNRKSAFNDNREYFFQLLSAVADKIEIEMYGTIYILVKGGTGDWRNHSSNKSALSPGLIKGVIETVTLN